jgi:hypothetical protein
VGVLRRYATEIESDISRYHHRDIRDWYRGKMTSRWLWSRITHLPDDSAFKTALRHGDWHTERYLLMHVANELKSYRADFAAAHEAKMQPQLILSPRQQREKDEEEQQRRDVRSVIMGQLRGEFTPPPRDVAFVIKDKRGGAHG